MGFIADEIAIYYFNLKAARQDFAHRFKALFKARFAKLNNSFYSRV